MTWQNVSSGVSDPARHKPACAATEASQVLEISAIESRVLSKQRTTKVLIRLRGCAGWSVPLLFTYDIRHIFSWPGSPYICLTVDDELLNACKPKENHRSSFYLWNKWFFNKIVFGKLWDDKQFYRSYMLIRGVIIKFGSFLNMVFIY